MDLLSSTFSSLASSFKSEYKGEEEEEELDQLLDEYWFFENLFHRKEKNLLSTADLWNNIQNHKNIGFDEEEEEEKKKQNQFGVDDKVSSTAPPNDDNDDLPKEKDGGKFVRQSSLRTSPSLPPSLGRDKEIYRRSSSKLSRQYPLSSSSKAVPQVHDSEFQYYKRHSSDPLYNNSMHNVQETVFENDQEMVNKEKKARDSKAITNSSSNELSTFVVYNSLLRAPSLPPSFGRSKKVVQEKESNGRVSRLTRQASLSSSKSVTHQPQESEIQDYTRHSSDPSYSFSSNNIQEIIIGNQKQGIKDAASITNSSKESLIFAPDLLRTPSLPPLRKEEEYLRRSSKLSRQLSLTSSDVMPPINIPKIGPQPAIRSPGIPRHRSKKEESSIHKDGTRTPPLCATKEVIRRSLSYKRSSSTKVDLEVEEVQGFKDLGFVFDTEQINKSLANIIPGLQEKKSSVNMEEDENEKKTTRRPYLSEAWLVQPSKPTVPAWVDKRSAGDMKEQLKYWARSVASNVRIQEC